MKNNILIVFAHPLYEKSRIHSALISKASSYPEWKLHDLYQLYPDFNIDIEAEQQLLRNTDLIVWQHPVYWYSIPPLLKQWIDLVFTFGWAYGKNGNALQGKYLLQCMSSGGKQEAYQTGGRNMHTLREFMAPHEQTARLCQLTYLPPFAVHGTHALSTTEINEHADNWVRILKDLSETDLKTVNWDNLVYINNWKKEN
jgi:glutathione-regulated potassium-efflux system ancillary protein KefG